MVWFPHCQHSVDVIRNHFGIQGTTYPGHDDGLYDNNRAAPLGQLAVDLWPRGAPKDQTQMIQVMNWCWDHRKTLNIAYVVGNGQKIKNVRKGDNDSSSWRQMAFVQGTRYNTNNHLDHCHVTFLPVGSLSNPNWSGGAIPDSSDGVLKEGDSGAAVTKLQQQLNLTGLYHLVVDGDFGPATTATVRDFQLRSHLGVDGVVGPQTQIALNVATSPKPAPSSPFGGWATLNQGDSGAHVVLWQKVLNALHANPKVTVDGDYGPGTAKGTNGLQHLAKLVEDGVAGPRTYNAAYFFLTLGKIDATKL